MEHPSASRPDGSIPEILAIDGLEDIADAYARRHGRAPSYLSHWDPGSAFVEHAAQTMRIPPLRDPIRYRFSYQLTSRERLLTELGYVAQDRRVLVTENGTGSVLAAANTLALLGVTKVALLAPCYFAARHALSRFGIEVRLVHWERRSGEFCMPDVGLGAGEALWLEDPIFNTGCSGVARNTAALNRIMREGHSVVVDEALSVAPSGLAAALAGSSRYFAIHAPHKAVCVNGLKFGAVTFHQCHYELFDHWADILNGGLSLSAEAALEHFLSDQFRDYARIVSAEVEKAHASLFEIVSAFTGYVSLDRATSGYWRTVYLPLIPSVSGEDLTWVESVVEKTGAIFIPGSRAAFHPSWGFCFRVNLLRLGRSEQAALRRLLKTLVTSRRHQE